MNLTRHPKSQPLYPEQDGMKVCLICKRCLPVDQFSVRKDGGLIRGYCKDCVVEYAHAHYLTTEKVKGRSKSLKHHWKFTVDEYALILEVQNGVCALCEGLNCLDPRTGKRKRLAVDHDHVTGDFRGLLCVKCNIALERVDTVPRWLDKVKAYLR